MSFGSAIVLCAAFLIAALPVRADSVLYTGTTDDSPSLENSAPAIRASAGRLKLPATARVMSEPLSALAPVWGHEMAYLTLPASYPHTELSASTLATSSRRLDAPQIDGQLSDPTPAIASIGGFESSSSFAAWGSEPSFIGGTPSSPPSVIGIHSTGLVEVGLGDPVSFLFDTDGARRRIGRDRGRGDDGKNPDAGGSTSVLVPEPGTLSLALFGLSAVVIFARRRQGAPTTT